MTDWSTPARALADELVTDGSVRDPRWRAAFEQIPRHLFVPRYHEQLPDGSWRTSTDDDPEHLRRVYRNEPLITALAGTPSGATVAVSASTKPGLMARMLEALSIQDGHRVLEIGTGTGYNAALLCHRLGDERVSSVDISDRLVQAARHRLATLRYAPALYTGDGAEGIAGQAPFDRIVATCSVPEIPPAWQEQLAEQGLLLVDFKRSVHGGNLVLLRRHGDRLVGRFQPKWAAFSALRHTDAAADPIGEDHDDGSARGGERGRTELDPRPWSAPVPWFLAHAEFPGEVRFGYRGHTDGVPDWACFATLDGSWAHIRIAADERGRRETVQGGPCRLWDAYERAHEEWVFHGRPDWPRFGLTVTPEEHVLWLDDPDGAMLWDVP